MGFLKDLFIVNEDKEKEKAAQQQSDATPQPQLSVKQPSAQPTIQPQQTVSQPYVYVPPTNTVASPGGNVSQEILKMISDVIEQHNMVTCLNGGKQRLPLGCFLLRFAHVAGTLHITDILDVELHIMLQPFHILLYALPDETNLGFADDGECNLHNRLVLD